jgi:seryl-tRNA synthetase
MEKLIKPSDYAKEVGISRQAVYAKIKKGLLQSKEIDGKLFVVVETKINTDSSPTTSNKKDDNTTSSDYQQLLKAKDETIYILKETIKDLKESNKEISTTLRSEIDLLKEAFYEMRNLYTNQIEYNKNSIETIEIIENQDIENKTFEDDTIEWISVKKFIKINKIKDKQIPKLKKMIKKLYKNGDIRFEKHNGKIKLDMSQDFNDILE